MKLNLTTSILLLFFVVFNACQKNPLSNETRGKDFEDLSQQIVVEEKNVAPQHVTSLPIPEKVTFAGEEVPLHRSEIREALEKELMVNTFRHSKTLKLIKELPRWKPFIDSILDAENIPSDFIYLAVAESEFDNTVRSGVGAMGMWQLMKATAKELGLKINNDVDMRRDPLLSTKAACKYLNKSNTKFNNWTLTAASYNRGVKGVTKAMEKQKVNSFYDMQLNPETARYVYRIIAFKLLLENPEAYGYVIPENEKYSPYEFTTEVIKNDIPSLVDYAKEKGTTYRNLRIFNPWFNNTSSYSLDIGRKDSVIMRIPKLQTVDVHSSL